MNAITKAISDVYFEIPKEILDLVFLENNMGLNNVFSLDAYIVNKVIRPKVLVDSNLVGGIEMLIPINKCAVTLLPNNEFIIDVPKVLTGGRSIIVALSLVSTISNNYNTGYTGPGQDLLNAGMTMGGNLSHSRVAQTSRLELLGESTILVQDPSILLTDGSLRVKIENSSNLENINPRSYIAFSHLATLAVKHYIYTNSVVKLDKASIYGGHELGIIKDIISEYKDAGTEYREYLTTKWRKILFMNDSKSYSRSIATSIGNVI